MACVLRLSPSGCAAIATQREYGESLNRLLHRRSSIARRARMHRDRARRWPRDRRVDACRAARRARAASALLDMRSSGGRARQLSDGRSRCRRDRLSRSTRVFRQRRSLLPELRGSQRRSGCVGPRACSRSPHTPRCGATRRAEPQNTRYGVLWLSAKHAEIVNRLLARTRYVKMNSALAGAQAPADAQGSVAQCRPFTDAFAR